VQSIAPDFIEIGYHTVELILSRDYYMGKQIGGSGSFSFRNQEV
jgi:hypothetical protein